MKTVITILMDAYVRSGSVAELERMTGLSSAELIALDDHKPSNDCIVEGLNDYNIGMYLGLPNPRNISAYYKGNFDYWKGVVEYLRQTELQAA